MKIRTKFALSGAIPQVPRRQYRLWDVVPDKTRSRRDRATWFDRGFAAAGGLHGDGAVDRHFLLLSHVHYREMAGSGSELSFVWKGVLLNHWRQESRHAIADELAKSGIVP